MADNSNLVLERQKAAVRKFFDENLEKMTKELPNIGVVLKNKNQLLSHPKKYFDRPYLSAFRRQLQDDLKLKYIEEVRPIILKVYQNLFHDNSYLPDQTYLEYINQLFENRIKDQLNADREWTAYIQHRFYEDYAHALHEVLPDHYITMNTALWSFSKREILPLYRYFSLNTPEDIFKQRSESFNTLAGFLPNYSTIWDAVSNNVNSMFYFDQVADQKRRIEIFEYHVPSQGTIKAIPKSTVIEATHRTKFPLNAAEYLERRRADTVEERYQYEVLRWYIRSGILDPRNAQEKRGRASITTENLLLTSERRRGPDYDELEEILEGQYRSSYSKNNIYTQEDNTQLDRVIESIDQNFPNSISYRVGVFEAGFFDLMERDDSINHIYWVPLVTNYRDRLIGGTFYINSDKPLEEYTASKSIGQLTDITEKNKRIEKLRKKLHVLTFYLSGIFGDKQIEEIQNITEAENKRSAGVSIIARNIGHNLGSHTLSYSKNNLTNELRMIESGVFEGIFQKAPDNSFFLKEEIIDKVIKKGELGAEQYRIIIKKNALYVPYLRALGAFLGHFQGRQDSIGSIASGQSTYYGTVHFKSAVLDLSLIHI